MQTLSIYPNTLSYLLIIMFCSNTECPQYQGGVSWLADTGCQLELYLDPERRLYSRLGLARSVWRVWQMATIQYYGSVKAQGRQLPAALEGVEDDPLQMGGDFTVRCLEEE